MELQYSATMHAERCLLGFTYTTVPGFCFAKPSRSVSIKSLKDENYWICYVVIWSVFTGLRGCPHDFCRTWAWCVEVAARIDPNHSAVGLVWTQTEEKDECWTYLSVNWAMGVQRNYKYYLISYLNRSFKTTWIFIGIEADNILTPLYFRLITSILHGK